MLKAHSHEVSSCGYWPGGSGEAGVFYSYAHLEAPGYRDCAIAAARAPLDDGLGEFVLPYVIVRAARDPDEVLLDFLEHGYEAPADVLQWDRAALERT